MGDSSQFMDNEKVLYQFSNALAYFWQCRVKELFPDKKIVVELGNELMGELGLCITMYEACTQSLGSLLAGIKRMHRKIFIYK